MIKKEQMGAEARPASPVLDTSKKALHLCLKRASRIAKNETESVA